MLPLILIDSNVILDILTANHDWQSWSQKILDEYSLQHRLCINPIIYTEISIGFEQIETLEKAIKVCGLNIIEIPKEALFLAGKVFIKYKKHKGSRNSTLSDFFIGAHASTLNIPLITRDKTKLKFYFPKLVLISP